MTEFTSKAGLVQVAQRGGFEVQTVDCLPIVSSSLGSTVLNDYSLQIIQH